MNKFSILAGTITLVIILGGVFLFSKSQNSTTYKLQPNTYEYFWGDGCPHCANVQAFFDTWEKKDQININKLEVWSNPANARIMQERAKACGISPSGMGVPLLFTPEGKCLVGDQPIINLFKSLQ